MSKVDPLFETCLRLGDTALVLGQRLAEWSSKAPTVELDIALSNHALDMIGQAQLFLEYAGRVEGKGRDEDALAYHRQDFEFRNAMIAELPKGDFACTMVRQLLFATYASMFYERMTASTDADLAAIAGKAEKEMAYHARHAGEWVVRLGDGTEESHQRAQDAVNLLWPYAHELFQTDVVDQAMIETGVLPDAAAFKGEWLGEIEAVLKRATLSLPEDDWMPSGGRSGQHTEHLAYLLAEMQVLPRAYPDAKW
ncbi:MAG: phenylacetate-CoA oxygenase subunit PaaC [Alphaproteobacteria bacterium]|nr:phenylacetate-CoA oxygenase subunit PaaC [Alphaproteobacteria bacterium]